jgi:hypothetical protein
MKTQKLYWGKTIASFFLVLFTMPLGHALMRVMEETMSHHAFIMGAVGLAIAIGCLVGSIFMFKYELKLGGWGPNIRMAISTVVIFWTTVEVFARNGLLTEFWVDPLGHVPEMVSILVTFLLLAAFLIIRSRRKKNAPQAS